MPIFYAMMLIEKKNSYYQMLRLQMKFCEEQEFKRTLRYL